MGAGSTAVGAGCAVFVLGAIVAGIAGIGWVGYHAVVNADPEDFTPKQRDLPYCTEAEQEDREALIESMVREGVIRDMEFSNGLPTVIVPESFLAAPKEVQVQTLRPIFAYWECRTGGEFGQPGHFLRIRIPDGSQLGRRVGVYSPDKGIREG